MHLQNLCLVQHFAFRGNFLMLQHPPVTLQCLIFWLVFVLLWLVCAHKQPRTIVNILPIYQPPCKPVHLYLFDTTLIVLPYSARMMVHFGSWLELQSSSLWTLMVVVTLCQLLDLSLPFSIRILVLKITQHFRIQTSHHSWCHLPCLLISQHLQLQTLHLPQPGVKTQVVCVLPSE